MSSLMKVMRYWLYFAAKLLLAGLAVWGLQYVVEHAFNIPPPPLPKFGKQKAMFMDDIVFTFAIFGVWLVGAGMFALILWDQRRRCRTCLRKLIMPVNSGSWGNMVVFGRPRTELICPFGHGTLSIEDLQITGRHLPQWQPHDDNIWKELEAIQGRK
jgi:hypothetical protein